MAPHRPGVNPDEGTLAAPIAGARNPSSGLPWLRSVIGRFGHRLHQRGARGGFACPRTTRRTRTILPAVPTSGHGHPTYAGSTHRATVGRVFVGCSVWPTPNHPHVRGHMGGNGMNSMPKVTVMIGPRPSTEPRNALGRMAQHSGGREGRGRPALSLPSVRGHQGTTPSSSKKPPRGPSSGRVASRIAIAAPCSGVRGALKPVKSVAT